MLSTTIVSLKRRKQDDEKLQDALYNLIRTLTLSKPPTEDFKKVFTRNMFAKNNKAAFQQVVYYLLHVLDPVTLEQKVPTWPVYENRQEVQFRKELLVYINELNSTYTNANIPSVMASHLISPGGHKFIKFMLKLTQFVVLEHFKFSDGSNFLVVTKDNNEVFTNKTVAINRKIGEMIREHEASVLEAQNEARMILEKLHILEKRFKEMKVVMSEDTEDFMNDEEFERRFSQVEEKVESLKMILGKIKEIRLISDQFSCEEIVLSHEIEEFGKNLNLLELFENLWKTLEELPLKMPHISNSYLKSQLANYKDLNEEMKGIVPQYNNCLIKIRNLKFKD